MNTLRSYNGIKIIGSGLTDTNLPDYFDLTDIFIVGSYIKEDGVWCNTPDPDRAKRILDVFQSLTEA